MIMNATCAQIKMLQTLRRQHGLDEETYRGMLAEATGGRTGSTKELSQKEAFALIDGLVKALRQAQGDSTWQQRNKAMDKMRRKIIGYAREMGWWLPGEMRVVDMERINGWCCKYGFGHKPINRYSYDELPKLVSQFEQGPYKHYLNKV